MIREMGIVSAWLASMGCEGVRRLRRECAAASLCAHRFLCIRIDDAFSAESSAMKVLAISGSLRAASINSALLRTAARLAPPDIEVALCAEVGELPLFNPDLEDHVPSSVARLRAAVAAADALLIASPEYAHGVTGTIKNALDRAGNPRIARVAAQGRGIAAVRGWACVPCLAKSGYGLWSDSHSPGQLHQRAGFTACVRRSRA
jgi:hypothetical protein